MVKNMENKRRYPRVSKVINPKSGMTKQSFKGECNINEIMAKFQKTGAINHYSKHAPQYMDIPSIDYQSALQTVIDAEDMFSDLPSSIRAKFRNDPQEFLSFVQDEANLEEMRELGLANPSSLSSQPDAKLTQSEHAPASTSDDQTEVPKA